jgi:hypothetical protein
VAKSADRRFAWKRLSPDDIENQPDLTRMQRRAIWSAADLDRLDAGEAAAFLAAVEEAIKVYRLARDNELGAPRPHEGKADLASIARDAEALVRRLRRLDAASHRLAEEVGRQDPAGWLLSERLAERATSAGHRKWLGAHRIRAIEKALLLLAQGAAAASAAIAPQGRGPADESLLWLVKRLAELYERYLPGARFNRSSKRAKGSPPPAVDLVTAAVWIVRRDLAAGSIDEAMRRVMERRIRQAVGK